MRRVASFLFMFLAVLMMATPVFAQGGTANPSGAYPWGYALAMAIASGLCGLGQGRATAGAAEALARNPGARAGIQFALILGLALIESLALYTLVIVFIK